MTWPGLTTLTMVRRTPGALGESGFRTDGTEVTSSFQGSVAPLSQDMLKRIPEGKRADRSIGIYTTQELRVGGADSGELPDLVVHAGQRFEVVSVHPWPWPGEMRYEVIAHREGS